MEEGFRFSAHAASDEGRVRDHNEDSFSITRVRNENGEFHLWVVADGMGGGARGEVASRMAIETLVGLLSKGEWHNPKDALREGFIEANKAVYDEGTAGGEAPRSMMGTTMVAILVQEATGRAWVANVGDSRLYLVTARGIWQVTRDHSLVAERHAAGLITEAEAKASKERNIITRAIGAEASVTPDVFDLQNPLGPNERVLLCSDGLHGMIDDARIGDLVGAGPAELATAALVAAANHAGGLDNITAIIGGDHAAEKMPVGWRRIKPQKSASDRWLSKPPKGTKATAAAEDKGDHGKRDKLLAAVGVLALIAAIAVAVWWNRQSGDSSQKAAAEGTPSTTTAADAIAIGAETPNSASATATVAPPTVTSTPTPTPVPPTPTPTPTRPLADRVLKGCWRDKPAGVVAPISTLASSCAALVKISFKDLQDPLYVRFCDKMKDLNPGLLSDSPDAGICGVADYPKQFKAPSDDWILDDWKKP